MKRFWFNLAPPTVDVSGAASVLFGLGGYTLIYDNQGCRGGIMRVDERRWARAPQVVESAQLSELQILMGDDEPLVEQAVAYAREHSPAFVALMGGPLSACTGVDLAAIAHTVRQRVDVPVLCIETNGYEWYHRGVQRALDALYEEFCGAGIGGAAVGRPCVNIVGAVLLDFENTAWLSELEALLEGAGFEVNAVLGGMRPSLGALARTLEADANLVVGAAALPLARRMEREHGIPYVVGLPMGPAACDRLVDRLRAACAVDGSSADVGRAQEEHGSSRQESGQGDVHEGPDAARALLLGEQVAMNALREALVDRGVVSAASVDVATFFAFEPALARAGDRVVADELDLVRLLREGAYRCVVADNLVGRVLEDVPETVLVPLPHAPLSSRKFVGDIPQLVGVRPDESLFCAVQAALEEGEGR